MTQPILVALIVGICSIISATLAALITKYGLPFWRSSTVIRAKGTASELFVILPDGSVTEDESGGSYSIPRASLKIGGDKVDLSAVLDVTMPTGEIIASNAELTGDGIFINGIA
ncbi:MAG: hypothetical protein WC091_08105 [Sulfuricellaceae bacterium]